MTRLPQYLCNPFILPGLFLAGAVLTALLTPLVKRLALRIGAVDQGGYRRVCRKRIPLLGGLAVAGPAIFLYAGLAVAGSLIIRFWRPLFHINPAWLNPMLNFAGDRTMFFRSFLVLAVGGIAILAVGFLDDLWGMRARVKLLAQLGVAIFICASGYVLEGFYLPFIGPVPLNPDLGVLVTIVWIVGLINAFNLIDGLDGLATGVALIAALALLALGLSSASLLLVFSTVILAGCLAAFLAFNFPPASIFLGDTGSMFIGYTLAVVTLMGTYKGKTAVIILGPLLALSFPIFETLVSMARRFVRGVPIFAGDKYHTHHRLLEKGFSVRRVTLIIYGVTAILAGAAYLSQALPENSPWGWAPGLLMGGTLLMITWWAGYLRPQALGRIFIRRQRNSVLNALARYAAQAISAPHHEIALAEIFEICRREIKLDCLEAWLDPSGAVICSCRAPGYQGDGQMLTKISPPKGPAVMVRYTLREGLSEEERIDATAALAAIFEQSETEALSRRLQVS